MCSLFTYYSCSDAPVRKMTCVVAAVTYELTVQTVCWERTADHAINIREALFTTCKKSDKYYITFTL